MKLGWRQAFCKNVSFLASCADVFCNNVLANVRSEPVIFQGQIFVAWGHLGNIDKGDAGLVVFENCGADKAGGNGRNVELGTNFEEQSSHGDKLSHGHAKRHILCRCGTKSDFQLQFALPCMIGQLNNFKTKPVRDLTETGSCSSSQPHMPA